MSIYNLISFAGIFILTAFAWLLSNNRKNFNFRLIIWAIVLQLAFALFIFLFPPGAKMFLFLNDVVVKVLDSATAGIKFVFGEALTNPSGEGKSLGFILAFQALPSIIFFSALMSILYFLKIMQYIIKGFAFVFTKLMNVSGAESLCAAANIFVGVESALTIKPYLSKMTKSELCTVLTTGMATVASNVMAIYVFTLQAQFPNIAGHLISASILSSVAAILMSKMIYPEDGKPLTLGQNVKIHYERENNIFEAIISGSNAGVKLIAGIAALLISVLGIVALINLFLGFLAGGLNIILRTNMELSLEILLGYIFYPFTIILGVPVNEAFTASKIIGARTITTEVPAYMSLNSALIAGTVGPRTAVITSYALCGFAHVASLAIFIGGTAALAPNKIKELTEVGWRALIAATLACLMTACIAGTFFMNNSILF